jgi:hypothetical protein
MSRQNEDGDWEHRIWCNSFFHPGPCKCCDRHTDWPYLSDLAKENPGKSAGELFSMEQTKNWPDAVIRPGTGPN